MQLCFFFYLFNLVKEIKFLDGGLYSLVGGENKKPQTNQPRISAENRTTITKVRLLVCDTHQHKTRLLLQRRRLDLKREKKKVLGVSVVGS